MRRNYFWSNALFAAMFSTAVVAQSSSVDIASLSQRMLNACPILWEDIADDIDPSTVAGDHWQGDTVDRDAFIAFIDGEMGASAPDANGLAAMADDLPTVAAECATQRLGLLDGLINKLPNDALAALAAVTEEMQGSATALSQDGFLVGDIRMTGRSQPAEGWIFLHGQTIGDTGSGADLEGVDYAALFDLAKTWSPNTGAEDFLAGHIVTLPDLRGRVVAGLDNMGGASADRLTAASADQVGGSLGAESHQLSVNEMPSHTHGMSAAGNHYHSYEDVRPVGGSTIDSGSGKGTSSDTKNTAWAGNHTHAIHAAGGSQAHAIAQPTILFNVEMKYL